MTPRQPNREGESEDDTRQPTERERASMAMAEAPWA